MIEHLGDLSEGCWGRLEILRRPVTRQLCRSAATVILDIIKCFNKLFSSDSLLIPGCILMKFSNSGNNSSGQKITGQGNV